MKLSELTVNEAAPLVGAGALALGRAAAPHIARGAKSGYNKLKGAIQTARAPKAPAAPAPKGRPGRKKSGAAQSTSTPAPAAPTAAPTAAPVARSAAGKVLDKSAQVAKKYPITTATVAGGVARNWLDDESTGVGDAIGKNLGDLAGIAATIPGSAYKQASRNVTATDKIDTPIRSADKTADKEPVPAAEPQPTYNLDLLNNESSEIISSILKLSGQRPITERDNTVGIIKPKQIKTLTENAQVAECGGIMPNSSTSSQPATLNISATASSGDEVANMLKSIMQLAGVKPVEPNMMPQGEILPTVKPTQILGKTLEQRLAEIESSTNSTEDFDEGLGRELGNTPRDNMIKRLSPTVMDQGTLMKSVAKVINSPEFTSDTVLKIVDAGSSITHPVGKFIQKEFDELQYDLGRKYEDMPEEVAEQLIVQLKQRTQGSVEESVFGAETVTTSGGNTYKFKSLDDGQYAMIDYGSGKIKLYYDYNAGGYDPEESKASDPRVQKILSGIEGLIDRDDDSVDDFVDMIMQRAVKGSVEEGACGDCGGNPCECAMEETYDNTPEERVEPYDPNNMAHVINKVSSKELASTPYQSASNPLSEAPVETKKVDEDVYHGLFKAYQEFKNSQ
jgi:hypothetical protein